MGYVAIFIASIGFVLEESCCWAFWAASEACKAAMDAFLASAASDFRAAIWARNSAFYAFNSRFS